MNPNGFILARISFPTFSAWLVNSLMSNLSYVLLPPADEHLPSEQREFNIFCVLVLCTAGKELNCSQFCSSSLVYSVVIRSLSWKLILSINGLGSFTWIISREIYTQIGLSPAVLTSRGKPLSHGCTSRWGEITRLSGSIICSSPCMSTGIPTKQ